MDYSVNKKVLSFIESQDEQVKAFFLEILDQIPILLAKIDKNLQANAFELAVEAKDIITQYVLAIREYAAQYHSNGIWSHEDAEIVVAEANRLYGMANELIVNKMRQLSEDKEHMHVHI